MMDGAQREASPLFAGGGAGTLRLVIYLSVAMVLMVVDHQSGYLQVLRQLASSVVEPLYRVAGLPADVARMTRSAVVTQGQLSEENRQLRENLLIAQARLNRYAALAAQNERLQQLLDVQGSMRLSVQLARLIDIDLDPFRHRVVLAAGSTHAVTVGQPVIDAHGIMGQVIEVLPSTSVVLLVTDPTHAIPVMVERTGLRTMAFGSGVIDRLELPTIPISADVQVGDRLVTSGLGGRFPAGFPVGEIRAMDRDPSGMFAAAVATPSAQLDRSGDVLLLSDLPEPFGPPELPQDTTDDGEGAKDETRDMLIDDVGGELP